VGTLSVAFGSQQASSFTVDSDTQITAISPTGAGTVAVAVTTPGGISPASGADQFIYVPMPTVTSIAPALGPATGGTQVTILGSNLSRVTAVSFGSTPSATVSVGSDTQLSAIAPAGTGAVDITVGSPGGTSATSAADQFTYIASPTATSISPTSGPLSGGTVVTVHGTNFTAATAVALGAKQQPVSA